MVLDSRFRDLGSKGWGPGLAEQMNSGGCDHNPISGYQHEPGLLPGSGMASQP